jgi:hypothetical protein
MAYFIVISNLHTQTFCDNRSIHRRDELKMELKGVQMRVCAGRLFEVSSGQNSVSMRL